MSERPQEQDVVVRDVQMPFLSMVVFMVKWALAAIPAMLVLFTAAAVFGLLTVLLFGSLGNGLRDVLSGGARKPTPGVSERPIGQYDALLDSLQKARRATRRP
jgi:hypothetical protein